MPDTPDIPKDITPTTIEPLAENPYHASKQTEEEKIRDMMLVIAARNGDQLARERLYSQYTDLVYSIVRGVGFALHDPHNPRWDSTTPARRQRARELAENCDPVTIFTLVIDGLLVSPTGEGTAVGEEGSTLRKLPGSMFNVELGRQGQSFKNWLCYIARFRALKQAQHDYFRPESGYSFTPPTDGGEEAALRYEKALHQAISGGNILAVFSDPNIADLDTKEKVADLIKTVKQKVSQQLPGSGNLEDMVDLTLLEMGRGVQGEQLVNAVASQLAQLGTPIDRSKVAYFVLTQIVPIITKVLSEATQE